MSRYARSSKFMACLMVIFALLWAAGLGERPPVNALVPREADETRPLHFSIRGHRLSFEANNVSLASINEVLRVEFLQGSGRAPLSESGGVEGRGMPSLGRVTYADLRPGISLTYEGVAGGVLKSPVLVKGRGDMPLPFVLSKWYLTESKPVVWRDVGGKGTPVFGEFKVGRGRVGSKAGPSNPGHLLGIGPTYAWHTFYGSEICDFGYGIGIDGAGNVYVVGGASQTWQIDKDTPPLHAHSGDYDIVVVKLSSQGVYQWHTFYGSASADVGFAIKVDGEGSVYVTGFSGATWLGDKDAPPLHGHSGGYDMAIVKLSPQGLYQWHTFYGSGSWHEGYDIAVDGSGLVYVTGFSHTTWQGDGDKPPLHGHSGGYDMAIVKLSPQGLYQWHTFYGSGSWDEGCGIAVDGSDNVYVTGFSYGSWKGDGDISPLNSHAGYDDIVVMKLSPQGAYQWHTFYGSAFSDTGYGIAIDGSSNLYVTGISDRVWEGDGKAAPLRGHGGGYDLMLLKLTCEGAYQWHTFYGSGGDDYACATILDGGGNPYVAGRSDQEWKGDKNEDPLHDHSGGNDIAVLKLTAQGSYLWHTFYGSASEESAYGIAFSGNGGLYVAGASYESWDGDNGESPLHSYEGPYEMVVLAISDVISEVSYVPCRGKLPCFDTISASIQGGDTGHTILIAEGAYEEAIRLEISKTLTLHAMDAFFLGPSTVLIGGVFEVKEGTLIVGRGTFVLQ